MSQAEPSTSTPTVAEDVATSPSPLTAPSSSAQLSSSPMSPDSAMLPNLSAELGSPPRGELPAVPDRAPAPPPKSEEQSPALVQPLYLQHLQQQQQSHPRAMPIPRASAGPSPGTSSAPPPRLLAPKPRLYTEAPLDVAGGPSASGSGAGASNSGPGGIGEASRPPPPVRKRKLPSGGPKGILKPAPPPQKTFSFRRDILQQLNSKLAQQGVNVQVPLPPTVGGGGGGLGGTAQGTAQAASMLIGGMFKRIGGFAAGVAAPGLASVNGGGSSFDGNIGPTAGGPSRDWASRAVPPGAPGSREGYVDSRSPNANGSLPSTPSSAPATLTSSSLNNLPSPASSARPLRRVQFQVSNMAVTYPISNAIAPGDEDATRIRVEREHRKSLRERRKRAWTVEELERLYRECCRTREEQPLKKMRLVFQEAAASSPPALRVMDMSFVPLDRAAIEPIADLLSVDFGLQKLVLENCGLTDEGLKSILHALLVSGTLPNLSLASNRKIKYHGWRYVGIFMRRARALRYLDLSENPINRASLEHVIGALAKSAHAHGALTAAAGSAEDKAGGKSKAAATQDGGRKENGSAQVEGAEAGDEEEDADDDEALDQDGLPLMPTADLLKEPVPSPDPLSPPPEELSSALISLRLENCSLKTSSLEMLAAVVRHSDLKHLSLRRNRIGQLGAVALALMLKDYPDSVPVAEGGGESHAGGGYVARPTPGSRQASIDMTAAGLQQARGRPSELTAPASRNRSYSPALPDVPVIVSSPGGGVTSRRMPQSRIEASADDMAQATRDGLPRLVLPQSNGDAASPAAAPSSPNMELERGLNEAEREQALQSRRGHPAQTEEEAIALYQAQRARRILSAMPRIGNLLTLDLKGNDIRGGAAYLAQALKKNRTLKVLNLSDNNLDMAGMVSIAEALRYNSTLETLDVSHNPCLGPGLDGIATLRTAFTLNSGLKRLFLNDTDLSSEGAIALAEYLPEAKSLIHLDLTDNHDIDIAGVMALAVSVKMNRSLRCLDLNIPPNDPDFARLSQDILTACINNTERAQRKAASKGSKQTIAAPIYKSVVARAAKEKEDRQKAMAAARAAEEQAARAQAEGKRANAAALVDAARECRNVLRDLLAGEEERLRESPDAKMAPPGDVVEELTAQSRSLQSRLARFASSAREGPMLGDALSLIDDLDNINKRLSDFYARAQVDGVAASPGIPRIDTTQATLGGGQTLSLASPPGLQSAEHLSTPVIESALSSPSFSIGSDDEDDDEDGAASSSPKTRASTGAELKSSPKLAGLGLGGEADEDAAHEDVTSPLSTEPAPAHTTPDGFDATQVEGGSSSSWTMASSASDVVSNLVSNVASTLSIGDESLTDSRLGLGAGEEEETPKAARDEDVTLDMEPRSPRSPTMAKEGKANRQLVEEGEVFKKSLAKMRNAGAEQDEEDEDQEADAQVGAAEASQAAETREDVEDVSGEELRKELLGSEAEAVEEEAAPSEESDKAVPSTEQPSTA